MRCIRILVVEDFKPWCRFISAAIEQEPQLQVVCEVSNGLEAVQKAEELKPDLISLDVGFLKLNGIAAARQIRTFSPKSKILFLSQESSTAVVREALEIGAGFVVKQMPKRSYCRCESGHVGGTVSQYQSERPHTRRNCRRVSTGRIAMSTLAKDKPRMNYSHVSEG